MSDQQSAADLPFREWQFDRAGDRDFARVIPAVKWNFFAERLRPLADDCATRVQEQLYVGVIHPFHYKLAKGWMGKIFRTVLSAPKWHDRGLSGEEALAEAFGPTDPGPAFVVYHVVGGPVYIAGWLDMLDLLRRGWLLAACDTFVLCAERSRSVALFWEGTGPYLGDRGRRSLTRRCTGLE